MHDLEKFTPQPFISKLLGLGDVQGLMEHIQDIATQNPDKQKEMAKKLEEGKLSIRDWREQIQNVMNMSVRFWPVILLAKYDLRYGAGAHSRRSPR